VGKAISYLACYFRGVGVGVGQNTEVAEGLLQPPVVGKSLLLSGMSVGTQTKLDLVVG
jgi:hypothetical protein